jgi:hypothetical protein
MALSRLHLITGGGLKTRRGSPVYRIVFIAGFSANAGIWMVL